MTTEHGKGSTEDTNNGFGKLFRLEFLTVLVVFGIAWGVTTQKVVATGLTQTDVIKKHEDDRASEAIKQEAIKDQLNIIGRDVSNLQVQVQFFSKSLEDSKTFQDKATEQQNQTLRILCSQFPASCP